MGHPKTLQLVTSGQFAIEVVENTFFLSAPATLHTPEFIKRALYRWYQTQATEYLSERLKTLSKKLGLFPKKVQFRHNKTRWGSCSSKGNISLNWLIIMAPVHAIDYILIHELCHLKEMNHSPRFWQLVAMYMPDYRLQKRWFKENGHLLTL